MEINNYTDYLIYNDGRVWTKKSKKFLKHGTDHSGYKYVNLSKQGKYKSHKIHRLIAGHYIPNPENKPAVDHKNRIRDDNRVDNLRWATHSENAQNRTPNNTKSGHTNICYHKFTDGWAFQKTINKKLIRKEFKSKTDAICYKFIIMLKIKTFENK